MTATWTRSILGVAIALAAVGTAEANRAEEATDWRLAATEDDRVRLRNWRTAWVKGIAQAKAGGAAAEVAALVGPGESPDIE